MPNYQIDVEWPYVAVFIVTAILSHARGTVLLLREFRLWFLKQRERRKKT
jgi:hypothetical protein